MRVLDCEHSTIVILGLLFYIRKAGRGYHREFIDDLNQEQTLDDIDYLAN